MIFQTKNPTIKQCIASKKKEKENTRATRSGFTKGSVYLSDSKELIESIKNGTVPG